MAFLLTGSKGGAVAILLAAIVVTVIWWRLSPQRFNLRWRKVIFPLTAAIAVALLAARPMIPRLIAAFGSEAHSWQFRWYLWKSTLRLIAAFPLWGSGPGTFEMIYPRYALTGFTRLAHENYLQLAAEGGLFLALLFSSIIAGGLLSAASSMRSADRSSALLGAGLLGGLVAFAVHGLVDSIWYVPAVAIALVALVSLSHSLRDMQSSPRGYELSVYLDSRAASPHPWGFSASCGRGACLILVLVFLAGACIFQWRISGAAYLSERARADNVDDALAAARRAVQLQPRCGLYHSQLAGLLFHQAMTSADEALVREAATEYHKAIACEPTVANHYYRLARLRYWNQENERAKRCLRAALHWNPNYTAALILWGDLLNAEGKKDEARQKFQAVVNISLSDIEKYKAIPDLFDENYIIAHLRLGQLALTLNNTKEAHLQLDRALRWCETYLRSGNPMLNAEAITDLPQVAPPKSVIRRLKAEVLAYKWKAFLIEGNRQKANDLFNEALDTDPEIAVLIGELTDKVR
jgi:tetratricopeptide (TPR) repeat protein